MCTCDCIIHNNYVATWYTHNSNVNRTKHSTYTCISSSHSKNVHACVGMTCILCTQYKLYLQAQYVCMYISVNTWDWWQAFLHYTSIAKPISFWPPSHYLLPPLPTTYPLTSCCRCHRSCSSLSLFSCARRRCFSSSAWCEASYTSTRQSLNCWKWYTEVMNMRYLLLLAGHLLKPWMNTTCLCSCREHHAQSDRHTHTGFIVYTLCSRGLHSYEYMCNVSCSLVISSNCIYLLQCAEKTFGQMVGEAILITLCALAQHRVKRLVVFV